jgi:hypothetical protein
MRRPDWAHGLYLAHLAVTAPWLLLPGTPEWSERWGSWPHCNGQGQCWMHYSPAMRWCRCRCGWCELARLVGRGGPLAIVDLAIDRHEEAVPGTKDLSLGRGNLPDTGQHGQTEMER